MSGMNENNDDFSLDIMKEMHEADATDANADNLARILSSQYDALVRKGFTPPQALDLLKTLMLTCSHGARR